MGVNFFRKIGHEGGECFGHIMKEKLGFGPKLYFL